jgi:hypothetical protein
MVLGPDPCLLLGHAVPEVSYDLVVEWMVLFATGDELLDLPKGVMARGGFLIVRGGRG